MCQRRQNSVIESEVYGIRKLRGKVKSEHDAQADRHVRIAGEIEIDLHRVSDESRSHASMSERS